MSYLIDSDTQRAVTTAMVSREVKLGWYQVDIDMMLMSAH